VKLTLADIADARAYERERESFRKQVIGLKQLRRVHIGTVLSLTFENAVTMRFQIQEMARVEKMYTDEAIQHEIDTYNALVPDLGFLQATLFIECTTDAQMKEWFPKLVGIERSIEVVIGTGPDAIVVPSIPEAEHDSHLTREAITSAVHYVGFNVGTHNLDRFLAGPVAVRVTHPAYLDSVELLGTTVASLAGDVAPAR
jgi:hypothetical protein